MQMDEDPASTPTGQVPYSRSFSVRLEGSGFSRGGSEGPSLGVLRVSEITGTADDDGSSTLRNTDLPTIHFVFPESPRRAAKQPLSSLEASTKGLGPLEAFQRAQQLKAGTPGTPSSSSPSSSAANLARSLTRILSPRPLQPSTPPSCLRGHWSSPSLLTGASSHGNAEPVPPRAAPRPSPPPPPARQSRFSSWGTSAYASPSPLSPPPDGLGPGGDEAHAGARERDLPSARSLSPREARQRRSSAPAVL
ncbi:hypothetical protein JCM21900_005958 [Sporobolomyces salmonicolor]